MMGKHVTIVEINIFERMLPLASGYLQAYASADPLIRAEYRFTKYTTTVTQPFTQIANDLSREDSDLYAFSCYLWNMGVVKSLLPILLRTNPTAHFLLGGPQVMRHAEQYLNPQHERLILCNGEGEKTFRNVLRELLSKRPDFSKVKGLSFYRDDELITTKAEDRIQTLEEIPSPFLNGVFDGNYRMAVLETNRGCPFRCAFCYWGAATNDRVYKFDENRIRDEITWLSSNEVPLLYLADANWGMLKRDIDIAQHIAECKEEHGVPFYVYFAAAKNSPDRVAQIANIFSKAEMLNTQPISMQSLDGTALEYVDRKNIKLSTFEILQEDLIEKKISSYIELIWPLPGETLMSFKTGIEKLCVLKAPHIIAYPHMLLHNTPLSRRKNELGLVTRAVEDGLSEAELIVQTAEVNYEEFKSGLRFFYAVLALYNTHILHRLANYLHHEGGMSYAKLLTEFVEFSLKGEHTAFTRFCEESIESIEYYEVSNYPTVYHLVLHQYRKEFEAALFKFVSEQTFWNDPKARFLFEIDMLAKPYIYANTPVKPPVFKTEFVTVIEASDRGFLLEIPEAYAMLVQGDIDVIGEGKSRMFRLDHKGSQYPFRKSQTREENASYCSGSIMRIADILPIWVEIEEVTIDSN